MLKLIFLILSTIFTIVTCYECGKSPSYQRFNDDKKSVSTILGGDDASERQWPWLVRVAYYPIVLAKGTIKRGLINNQLYSACTATIISDQWILTAAHCVNRGYSDRKIMIGIGSVTRKNTKYYEADGIIIHPKYRKIGKTGNDIALVKLKEKLQFNEHIQPICLSKFLTLEENEVVAAAGWGYSFPFLRKKTKEGKLLFAENPLFLRATIPDIVQERHVVVRNEENCFNLTTLENPNTKYICVGGQKVGMLGGDSGGALMARRSGSWYHVGNAHTSASSTNTRIDTHDEVLYTETMQYCDFIEHSTNGEVRCEE